MKLYQLAFSPACQKVVAVAHEVGTPLELVNVNIFKGEARAPALLAKNANAKVPILEDGDFVLWESSAMIAYIAAQADRRDLAPVGARERADVDRWLLWEGAHFGPAIRRVAFERVVKKLAGLGAPDEAAVKAGSDEFAVRAAVLEQQLARGPYVCGALTIADFALAPYAALAIDSGLDLERYPAMRAWLARMVERDSMQRTFAAARGAA